MKINLKNIDPNPFRDTVRNPLKPAKIERLVASIKRLDFWDNCVIRKKPGIPGRYELAYGHHRLEAARLAGLSEADFILKSLDDAAMLQIMAEENNEDYKNDVLAVLEAVRGVVTALADGRIPAFVMAKDVNKQFLRYAPSFAPGGSPAGADPERPYTVDSVARFLGAGYVEKNKDKEVATDKVVAALNALYLISIGKLSEKEIAHLPITSKTGNPNLLQMTRDLVKRVQESKAEIKAAEARTLDVSRKLSALDAERHATEQAAKVRKDELIRKEIEANQARDVQAAKDAVALRKQEQERGAAREAAYKVRRDALDKIVEERKTIEEAARNKDKNLPTRYAVKTMLGKLKLIPSENFSFREEVKTLARNPAVSLMERDLLYKAMKEAGQWYFEWGEKFAVTPKHTGVLAEARKREDAKRKLTEAEKEKK